MNKNFDRNIGENDVMRRRVTLLQRIHVDGWLLFIIMLLAGTGFFILYSGSGRNLAMVHKQMMSFSVGLVAMLVVAQLEPRFMARWSAPMYLIGLGLLVVVELFGHRSMGATRWINIPGLIRFQPSELMKVLVPMTLAWYLARQNLPVSFRHVVISLLLVFIPFVLIVRQPDLGTAVLVALSGLFVLFLSGLRWRWIVAAVAAAVPLMIFMWLYVMRSYQRQRVKTFLHPESDPLGSGWNIIQAKAAIGSGGVLGKGWLAGTQSHLDFLPESHTDFIIAVLAEEFGLVGVGMLLLLYLLLLFRAMFITMQAQTMFGKLLAGALTLTFFVYVFVNIGMVSGLLPVVGVPLPFISFGGTSMVTLMITGGILMSIHTHRKWISRT